MNQRLIKHCKANAMAGAALMIALIASPILTAAATAATDDAEGVRAVLLGNVTAFERGDMVTLGKLWANDDSVTVFEQGHANYGWADYRDNHLGPEAKEMKNTKYALSDIKIKTSGSTAWATFKYTISADVEARHVDGAGLGTAVLEKRQERWQIVHWHSSAPRRAPLPAPK